MLAVRVWSTYQKDNIKLQEWCDGVRIADLKFSEQIHGLTLDQCVQTFFFNAETPKIIFLVETILYLWKIKQNWKVVGSTRTVLPTA